MFSYVSSVMFQKITKLWNQNKITRTRNILHSRKATLARMTIAMPVVVHLLISILRRAQHESLLIVATRGRICTKDFKTKPI